MSMVLHLVYANKRQIFLITTHPGREYSIQMSKYIDAGTPSAKLLTMAKRGTIDRHAGIKIGSTRFMGYCIRGRAGIHINAISACIVLSAVWRKLLFFTTMLNGRIRFYKTPTELTNVLGTVICLGLFYLGPVISFFLCALILFSPLHPLLFVYAFWIYFDRNQAHKGGRRSEWLCSSWIYKSMRQYFPHTLVKTSDLPPDQNYIFCLFPHGIMVTAGFAHFLTNSSDFNKKFPGLTTSFHTLNSNFLYPFIRDYNLFSGLQAVSKEALMHQLSKPGGRAVVIVPGGSAEAAISQPGTQRLILKNRKGFIKLAMVTGTSLVPVYAFGETDLFDHRVFEKNSLVFKIQEYLRKLVGFAFVFPFINGGGFFQDRFGLIPRPRPVITVVGKPIRVEKTENPSHQEVNAIHDKFVNELVDFFESHKHKYLANAHNVHLSIEEL